MSLGVIAIIHSGMDAWFVAAAQRRVHAAIA
jgi:hypothetical protein